MKEENFKFLIKLNINEEEDSILIFRYMRSLCRRFFFSYYFLLFTTDIYITL